MKIHAVLNPKGGVGKSTSMANLAVCAEREGNRTLIIDLDPNRSLTMATGIKVDNPEKFASSLLFSDNPKMPSDLAVSTEHGFDLVISGADLTESENWLRSAVASEMRLSTLFDTDKALQEKYDNVFLDIGGRPGPILNTALFASQRVLVPLEASATSADQLPGILELYNTIRHFQAACQRPQLEIAGIFFSIVSENTRASTANINAVCEAVPVDIHVCETVIPKATIAEDAILMRKMVLNYDPDCLLSQRYRNLYKEIMG